MSAATLAHSQSTRSFNLQPPLPDDTPPPQPCGDAHYHRSVLAEEREAAGGTSEAPLGLAPTFYQSMSTPATEILDIFRRSCPGVVLHRVTYPTAPPVTLRQWHPAILMPSHLRAIQAVAACWRLRNVSQPVVAVKPVYMMRVGPPMGHAAPAA